MLGDTDKELHLFLGAENGNACGSLHALNFLLLNHRPAPEDLSL